MGRFKAIGSISGLTFEWASQGSTLASERLG
jgi:hypothetical protein